MKEEFVTLEIAKKLKEKGCPLREVYRQDGNPILYDLPKSDPNWFQCNAWYIPSIPQVLKWLREEKDIHISTTPYINEGHELKWLYNAIIIKASNMYIFTEKQEREFASSEEAALAGIEYVLDNLI